MGVRRVVTGQDRQGKSIVVSDETLEPRHTATTALTSLWSADEPPKFPQDGTPPRVDTWFPGPGAYRFVTWTLAPNSVSAPTDEEIANMPEDVRAHMERDEPGMHTSDSVDLELILAGEVTLELDDGAIVRLNPGDFLIQNGTRHRWSNRGSIPATIMGVMVGGHPRGKH